MRTQFPALCIALCAATASAQEPAHWRLEPVATIEGVSATEPFGVVRSLALRRDGRLAVVDRSANRVSLFDVTGRSLGYAGRIGSGPGETRQPYAVAWLADTLAILDPVEAHIVFLTHGQTPLGQTVVQRITGGNTVRFYPVSPTKAYTVISARIGAESKSGFAGYAGRAPRDTVIPPELATDIAWGTECNRPDGGISFFRWPEAPTNIRVPVRPDGGIVIGSSGEYRLTIRGANGATLGTLSRGIRPAPIADSTWNAGLDDYRKHVAQFGAASCKATPTRPKSAAPIRAVTAASDGSIWVTVLQDDGLTFDVFSSTGQLRAVVSVPKHDTNVSVAVAGDRVAIVAESGDGAPVVRLYRVVR
ncbi:MAG TPA: hypothetical protein VJR92_03365 [Gemmatimonadaceae bacterium]|nr:hypothetical protein [Gemmatimonadaceae bacterium]